MLDDGPLLTFMNTECVFYVNTTGYTMTAPCIKNVNESERCRVFGVLLLGSESVNINRQNSDGRNELAFIVHFQIPKNLNTMKTLAYDTYYTDGYFWREMCDMDLVLNSKKQPKNCKM